MYRSKTIIAQSQIELLAACQVELDLGLQNLEDIYRPYFETDIDTLEEEKTYDVKLWYATICRACKESGYEYRSDDKISDSLRKWVGLQMEKKHRK